MFGGIWSRGRMVGNAGTRAIWLLRVLLSCFLAGWYDYVYRPGCPEESVGRSCPRWGVVRPAVPTSSSVNWSAAFGRGSCAVPKNMVLALGLTHLVIDLIHWLEYGSLLSPLLWPLLVVVVAMVVANDRGRGHVYACL